MRYRRVGRCGLKVSVVGLGSWLTYGGSVAEETATECVHRAYELGVTLFDTANEYQRGRAEEVLGKAVAGYRRESYVLATKVYFPMGEGPNDRGLSRKHVREQLDASLRRLGVDYLDLYQCHRYDRDTPLEETCRAMEDFIRAGKILYWGVSEWNADQITHAVALCRASGWNPPVSNQPQYSLLRSDVEQRVLPVCEALGLGTLAWSPLAMGVLTGKYPSLDEIPEGTRAAGDGAAFMARYLSQDVLDAVQQLRPVAAEAGVTTAQLALAWCLRHEAVASVIVGATSTRQLQETTAVADQHVPHEAVTAAGALLAAQTAVPKDDS